MLDPEPVDLADLALALEDNSREHSWWFDPVTGRLEPHLVDDIGEVALDPAAESLELAHHEARGLARVDASERFTEARSLLPVRGRVQIADRLEQLEAQAVARALDLPALGLDLGPAHSGVLRRRCVAEGGHASSQRVSSPRPLHRATTDRLSFIGSTARPSGRI